MPSWISTFNRSSRVASTSSPRSSSTLPRLTCFTSFFLPLFLCTLPAPYLFSGYLEASFSCVQIFLGSLVCPFFECVENVDETLNLLEIDNPVPCSFVLIPKFKYAASNTWEWLAIQRRKPSLYAIQIITKVGLRSL